MRISLIVSLILIGALGLLVSCGETPVDKIPVEKVNSTGTYTLKVYAGMGIEFVAHPAADRTPKEYELQLLDEADKIIEKITQEEDTFLISEMLADYANIKVITRYDDGEESTSEEYLIKILDAPEAFLKEALIEYGTSVDCGYCPIIHEAFDLFFEDTMTNGDGTYGDSDVVNVMLHHGDLYDVDLLTCDASSSRQSELNYNSFPIVYINGSNVIAGTYEGAGATDYENEIISGVDKAIDDEAKIALTVSNYFDEDAGVVNITGVVYPIDNIDGYINLMFFLTDSNISYTGSNGVKTHDYVSRERYDDKDTFDRSYEFLVENTNTFVGTIFYQSIPKPVAFKNEDDEEFGFVFMAVEKSSAAKVYNSDSLPNIYEYEE